MPRLLVVVATVLVGCAPPRHVDPVRSFGEEEQGDARVGQYVSSDWSFETASYWIEGPEGLVIIDTQFLPSATRKAREFAERRHGRKAALAIVLHANPDRFDGTGHLRELGIPVVTSEQVRAQIPAVHTRWAPVLAPKYWNGQYRRELTLPESFGRDSRTLEGGGLGVKAHVLGAGCSPSHVVIEWEGHLFTGDLVSAHHSWFEGGDGEAWLARIEELRALDAKWIHPGRGQTGGPELLDAQKQYLEFVRATVAAARSAGPADDETLLRLKAEIVHRFPDRKFPAFLDALIRDEWRRQAGASDARSVRHGLNQDRRDGPDHSTHSSSIFSTVH